jgi:hypothetical protein
MIGRGLGERLVTFRVWERIDEVVRFEAERLPDHRELYLEYEGPIPGGRGAVKRVLEGSLEIGVDSPERFECWGMLGVKRVRFVGRPRGERWVFERGEGCETTG